MQTLALQLFLKRDSDTGVFLRILSDFQEHLLCRTPLVAASIWTLKDLNFITLALIWMFIKKKVFLDPAEIYSMRNLNFWCFLNIFLALYSIKVTFLSYYWKQPPEVFYKKGVYKNFAKFTGENLCQSLFFNKLAGHGV